MKNITPCIFVMLLAMTAQAQNKTAAIFNKTIQQIRSLKSISYSSRFTNKNPFSEGDISNGESTAAVIFNKNGTVSYMTEETNINEGQIVYRKVYSDARAYSFNITDSTYTDEIPKEKVIAEITEIASLMDNEFKRHPDKVFQKKDTLYQGKNCYNFLIKGYDTLVNGNHDYTFKQVLIDKSTMMPIYLKETGVGNTYKGGLLIGRLVFFDEKFFSNIELNKEVKILPIQINGFTSPNTQMLNIDEKAPELVVQNIKGEVVNSNDFKDKILLVIFGATSCAANPLANPMLNKIYNKYSSKEFSVLNIYTNETSEQVYKYVVSNNLKFPVYLGQRKLNKDYKTLGTPNFYLIDRNGKIAFRSNGYSESLENKLSGYIDKLLAR